MTNALAYNQLYNKLPRRTAHNTTQHIPARRPGITTGFSAGKKLPHDGAKRLQSAAPGYKPAYYSFIDPGRMKG